MIINSILSLAFLWAWTRCHTNYKKLSALRRLIANSPILSVQDAIQKIQQNPNKKPIFMLVKGLISLKFHLKDQKSLYSVLQRRQIRQGKLAEHLLRRSWQQLKDRASYVQPHSISQLQFNLKDMSGSGQMLGVKGCREGSFSGALTQLYTDRNITGQKRNFLVRSVLRVYNYIASRAPLSIFLPTTKIGEEHTLYGVQQGQYAVVIGQFANKDGEIVCNVPRYVTKQRSYIESNLLKRENKQMFISFLLACLLVIWGIFFVRRAWEWLKRWKALIKQRGEQAEDRSENEGENCNCIICFVNVRNIVFKPCRHYAVCKSCLQLLPRQACPYCKKPIEDTIQIVKRR